MTLYHHYHHHHHQQQPWAQHPLQSDAFLIIWFHLVLYGAELLRFSSAPIYSVISVLSAWT